MVAYDSGAPWAETHDVEPPPMLQVELVRAMIQLILSNRATLYSTPGLAEVANNKGDRINKKIQSMLARMVAVYPWADGMVKEEVTKISAAKSWKRTASDAADGSPTKKAKRPAVKREKGSVKTAGTVREAVKVEIEEDELESE